MKKHIILIVFLLLIVTPCLAYDKEPIDALKMSVEKVISLLKDPLYQGDSQKNLQRDKIWEVFSELFNFTEMAKRTLAINWKKFTIEQRQEFTDLFAELLGNSYIGRIQGEYEEDETVFEGQKIYSGSKARVKTKILRRSTDIPVVYSMLKRNGVWKVYDVKIEGVSLVKNYRTQFNKILMKNSPSQLIERLKKKIESQEKKRAKKD